MADLNKNKIIFKSEKEIEDFVANMVDDALLPCDIEEHEHRSEEKHSGCKDMFEKSIQLAVDKLGREELIQKETKRMVKQQELDLSVQLEKLNQQIAEEKGIDPELLKPQKGPGDGATDGECWVIPVNIIVNGEARGGAVRTYDQPEWLGAAKYIEILNAGMASISAGPGIYGSRKQQDCGIRFVLDSVTELTGTQVKKFTSDSNYEASVSSDPLGYGFKRDVFNIHFSDINENAADVVYGAWAMFPYGGFPYAGWMNFPQWNTTYNETSQTDTLLHEIGHNLGLPHVFGNCGAGSLNSCNCGDDGVSDTPLQKPTFPPIISSYSLALGPPWPTTALCGDNDGDGVADPSMPENWMDYSQLRAGGGTLGTIDDKFFTQGQSVRMNSFFEEGGALEDYAYKAECTAGAIPPGPEIPVQPKAPPMPNPPPATVVDNHLLFSGRSLATSIENQFLGDNFGHYRQVHKHTFKGWINSHHNSDFQGVKQSLSTMDDIMAAAHDKVTVGFSVIGDEPGFKGGVGAGIAEVECTPVNLGKGKITSIDFSENPNPVRMGAYTIQFETYTSGSLSQMDFDTDVFPAGTKDEFQTRRMQNLEDFSENFSFETAEDGAFSYSHSISMKYFSGEAGVDYVTQGQALASALFNAKAPKNMPFVGAYAGVYDSTHYLAAENRFDETYDLSNLNFSFTKKFSQLSTGDLAGNNSSHTHSRSLTYDNAGVATVTENGTIQARKIKDLAGTQEDNLITDFNALVGVNYALSYTACNNLLAKTVSANLDTSADTYSLATMPISVTKGYDPANLKLDYSVTFSNDAKYDTGYIREYTLNLSEDFDEKILTVSENGSFKQFKTSLLTDAAHIGMKNTSFDNGTNGNQNIASVFTDTRNTLVKQRVTDLINNRIADQGILTQSALTSARSSENARMINYSFEWPSHGTTVNYTVEWAVDGSFLSDSERSTYYLNWIKVEESDNAHVNNQSQYMIPRFGEINQQIDQSSIGTRDITVTAQFSMNAAHSAGYDPNSGKPPGPTVMKKALEYMKEAAMIKVRKIHLDYSTEIIRDIWISDLSHSWNNNDRLITLNLQASWVAISKSVQNQGKRGIKGAL